MIDYTPERLQGWRGTRLAGQSAIVTGAGRGIGKGVALLYAAQGARVLACDIDADALARLQADAAAAGLGPIHAVAADLTTEAGAASLAEVAEREFGDVEILVNAAAIVAFAWIEEMTFADWRRTLAGELDTVFLVTRSVWPLMKRKGGSIINFSSANAHVALDTSPAIAHCAGKGGVLAMTRQMAMEGGKLGIRANSIAPGFTLTEETERHLGNAAMMSAVRAKLMLEDFATPEDIGWLAVYLGSRESRFVTGADISIDGGATAW
jgi:NAD(P)-dependent dehydrogenase (short-subunit alcohol dehydrogenase family)